MTLQRIVDMLAGRKGGAGDAGPVFQAFAAAVEERIGTPPAGPKVRVAAEGAGGGR